MRIILCIFSCWALATHAINPPNNAIALGTGGACVTHLNAFAIENNVGALASVGSVVALNAGNLYGLSDYSHFQVVGIWQEDFASLGITYKNTPFNSFTEQKVQIGIAKNLAENLSMGISLDYIYWKATDPYYVPVNILTGSIGILYTVNKKLDIGFSANNPTRSKYSDDNIESYPSLFRFGTSYDISSNITTYADVLQVSGQNINLQIGAELTKEKYKIRGGFDLQNALSIGLGYETEKIDLAASASYHNQLGLSPSLLLSYAF